MENFVGALDPAAQFWFGAGLGLAFLATMVVIGIFMLKSRIDHGFLGLILLLTVLFYLIAFSLLVAASVHSIDVKLLVAVVDAFALLGGKLLSDRFIVYLESGDDEGEDSAE